MSSGQSQQSRTFRNVRVAVIDEDGVTKPKFPSSSEVLLIAEYDPEGMLVRLCSGDGQATDSLQEFLVKSSTESARVGQMAIVFHLDIETIMIRFSQAEAARSFVTMVSSIRTGNSVSVFKDRTEEASAAQYFQFYGYLSQQQNMMQDFVRTSTYQKAILSNLTDFRNKVVLDVGAGSGILSFFAQQAGAAKVYAVEGSSIAKHAAELVRHNKVDGVIKVLSGKIEEIELPEKVDMIISEPMGYMLLNERMLETYLHAKKWLKPEGKMFPSRGDLHVAPFTDEALYMEQINKVNFWYQEYFHGVNLGCLRDAAMKEYFRQPIVDTFDIRICMAKTQRHVIDFGTAEETELHRIEIPLEFHMLQSGMVHGLAFWFDVAFIGSGATVWLSTAPTEALTHWYQVRCLLQNPILVKQGQVLTGRVLMVANMKQSYDVTIECKIMGTSTQSLNTLDLKNPYFRYTGVQPAPPPGESNVSPSEAYWSQVDLAGARQAVDLVNGMIVDGLGHVSLDSSGGGNQQQQQQQQTAAAAVIQGGAAANIHQGSIPATGRKNLQQNGQQQGLNMVQQGVAVPVAASAAAAGGGGRAGGGSTGGSGANAGASSTPTTPMSAANSLQFNQLIGGAVSPSILAAQPAAAPPTAAHQQQQAAAAQNLLFAGADYSNSLNTVLGGAAAAAYRQ